MTLVNAISVSQAADSLGVTPARVRQLCQENDIGELIHSRTRLLENTDVERLREILKEYAAKNVGRPRKKT